MSYSKNFVGDQKDDYQYLRGQKMKNNLGRFLPEKKIHKKFLEKYLSEDQEPIEKEALPIRDSLRNSEKEDRIQARNLEKEESLKKNVDPEVNQYANIISRSSSDLEQFLQREDKGLPLAPIVSPPKSEEKKEENVIVNSETIYNQYYKLLGRISLNNLTPNEYFEFIDLLMGNKRLNKTINGQEYIRPSDLQRFEDEHDLLFRYMTGGEGAGQMIGQIMENTNADKSIINLIKGNELSVEEEKFLEAIAKEEASDSNNDIFKLAKMKQGFEREYYFDPTQGEGIENHLKKIRAVPGIEVTCKKDAQGFYIVKKKLKLPFKYNLSEFRNSSLDFIQENMHSRFNNLLEGITKTSK